MFLNNMTSKRNSLNVWPTVPLFGFQSHFVGPLGPLFLDLGLLCPWILKLFSGATSTYVLDLELFCGVTDIPFLDLG